MITQTGSAYLHFLESARSLLLLVSCISFALLKSPHLINPYWWPPHPPWMDRPIWICAAFWVRVSKLFVISQSSHLVNFCFVEFPWVGFPWVPVLLFLCIFFKYYIYIYIIYIYIYDI